MQQAETKTARRKRLKAERAATSEAEVNRQAAILYRRKQRLRYSRCYPSEARMEAAATGKPFPAEKCPCERCEQTPHEGWPVGYRRGGKSYECWLHEWPDHLLMQLPSSSSIVRFGEQ